MIFVFLSALTVGFSGAMMPGSLLTYTLRQFLSVGRRAGFIITTGHAILEGMLVILIFMGFDTVLSSGYAQIGIGLVGGALLMYMGVDMIRGSIKNTVKVQTEGGSDKSKNLLLSGILISAANPYFLLWWAIVGLGFIMDSFNLFGIAGVAVYYIGHICADYIWYGTISVFVGTTRKFIREKPYRIVIAALGCLLLFFGGKFMYAAITGIASLKH